MKYFYENLSEDQFELLIVHLCQRLLGIATQGFAKGPDGGRDAKFVGSAEIYPSANAPWKGTVIIQAKHTNGHNRSFSETDFYSPNSKNTVVGKEIPRIQKLRAANQLDHYMLFSNRRLTGNSETDIKEHISKECDLPISSIALCGLESIESLLRRFKEIAEEVELDPVDSPLIISPDDIAEIVQALARQQDGLSEVIDDPPVPRITYEQKNVINNMTTSYAKEQRSRYLKDTQQIRQFLAAPENLQLQRMYESVTEELQFKIIAKRKDHQTFDAVMEYLLDLLYHRDPVLKQHDHRRLTRAMLFYMYWNCDIGLRDEDAQTIETCTS